MSARAQSSNSKHENSISKSSSEQTNRAQCTANANTCQHARTHKRNALTLTTPQVPSRSNLKNNTTHTIAHVSHIAHVTCGLPLQSGLRRYSTHVKAQTTGNRIEELKAPHLKLKYARGLARPHNNTSHRISKRWPTCRHAHARNCQCSPLDKCIRHHVLDI